MTALTSAARRAIPGLIQTIGKLPPGWRAGISAALVLVLGLLAFLAVRHEQTQWLDVIGSVVASLLLVAFGASGGDSGKPPPPAGPTVLGALVLGLVLVPGCAVWQDAATALTKAEEKRREYCSFAVDIVAHCNLLRERRGEDDMPAELVDGCERAESLTRSPVCGGSNGDL